MEIDYKNEDDEDDKNNGNRHRLKTKRGKKK